MTKQTDPNTKNEFNKETSEITPTTKKSEKDYQEWLKLFLEENGEALDELAKY